MEDFQSRFLSSHEKKPTTVSAADTEKKTKRKACVKQKCCLRDSIGVCRGEVCLVHECLVHVAHLFFSLSWTRDRTLPRCRTLTPCLQASRITQRKSRDRPKEGGEGVSFMHGTNFQMRSGKIEKKQNGRTDACARSEKTKKLPGIYYLRSEPRQVLFRALVGVRDCLISRGYLVELGKKASQPETRHRAPKLAQPKNKNSTQNPQKTYPDKQGEVVTREEK